MYTATLLPMETHAALADMTTFFNQYTQFVKQIEYNEIEGYRSFFTHFQQLQATLDNILRTSAPYYNIFNILNVHSHETKLHTPFLCHLLTPTQSHEQGMLFFNSFLEALIGISAAQVSNVSVSEELSFYDGRIDMFITYTQDFQKKAILIENKVYAGDQSMQLERYCEYLLSKGYSSSNFKIIYLTPYRKDPTPHSISPQKLLNFKNQGTIICLGYNQDISKWLTNILDSIQSIQVKEIVKQYIHVIKHF